MATIKTRSGDDRQLAVAHHLGVASVILSIIGILVGAATFGAYFAYYDF